ncbi:MAG: DUF1501 domain-containing protein [Pirellulales bacterium]|nr:DUF1501 domain-containing protein [Planctomycetales bacterium]
MRRTSDIRQLLARRRWLRHSAAAVGGISLGGFASCGWFSRLARAAANNPARRRSCILLWMSGGPSQLDTFDPKPDHENGGSFAAIETSVPGIRLAEHLPKLATRADKLAIVRSMTSKEGDHDRGTYFVRTGYRPQGAVRYPPLGALVAHELGDSSQQLPGFVSVLPNTSLGAESFTPGFLGPRYAPLVVGGAASAPADGADTDGQYGLEVESLTPASGIDTDHFSARLDLMRGLEDRFVTHHTAAAARGHQTAYERAVRMMSPEVAAAFDLSGEPAELRDAYGRNRFGQGCLLARRLIEQGVPFVEVTLSGVDGNAGLGWDTHADNFRQVRGLCETLDPAWSTLIDDLADRGLLDSTLILWMGEFGRTPKINQNTGRDHFPQAWSAVLGGGGIRGGQSIGATSADGMEIKDRPVEVPDFLATACTALGIDPATPNNSNVGRPVPIVDMTARVIDDALA